MLYIHGSRNPNPNPKSKSSESSESCVMGGGRLYVPTHWVAKHNLK